MKVNLRLSYPPLLVTVEVTDGRGRFREPDIAKESQGREVWVLSQGYVPHHLVGVHVILLIIIYWRLNVPTSIVLFGTQLVP